MQFIAVFTLSRKHDLFMYFGLRKIIMFRSLRKHLATVNKSKTLSSDWVIWSKFDQSEFTSFQSTSRVEKQLVRPIVTVFAQLPEREHIGRYRCLEKQSIIRTDSERFWASILTNFLPAFSA